MSQFGCLNLNQATQMPFASTRRAIIALILATPLVAQDPGSGRVVGRVVDAETGRALSDAGVQIVGTTLGTQTGIDGSYSIAQVPAGNVTIQVRRLGFQPKTITGLRLDAGGVIEQNVSLSANVTQIAAMTVTAAAERGSVENALDAQRNADGVVNSVTAEQISRSPDGNAAQAIQRVSGVSVQDGKYVIARGLGERYTTTSLNGSRVPSPEPERKVVPLDLFPSGLIQTVTTTKTFTPDMSGDFSGANVDIRTREFPAERQVSYGLTVGSADGTWGKRLPFARGVGGEAFALAGSARDIPADANAAGNLTTTNQAQGNAIINSFRNVWRVGTRSARPNVSARASVGGSSPLFGQRIGYLFSTTYSYAQDAQEEGSRALARSIGAGQQLEVNKFAGDKGGESVLLGGLMNLSTLVGRHHRLSLNALYNRSADNDASVERGFVEDLATPLETQVMSYVERSVWSTQLTGEHERGRQAFEWSVTGAGVSRNQPDRSELTYQIDSSGAGERLLWMNSLGEGAVRTFATLDEKSFEGKGSWRREFGPPQRPVTLKVGGLGRGVSRDADTRSFGIFATIMNDTVRALPPEELFGGRFTKPDSSVLTLRSLSQGGSYVADEASYAGFAMVELPVTDNVRVITGARYEWNEATVTAMSTLGQQSVADRIFGDVLPALAVNYRPGYNHALRFSASRTLARPEYREMAGIRSRDVLGGIDVRGNPDLVRTLIDNVDARYEFYPRRGEVLSIGVFAKRFHNPIERVMQSTSTSSVVTFANADRADNFGTELEVRKDLDEIAEWLSPFTVFGGATIMRSQINLGDKSGANTNPNRAMVGQSPYVLNAGVSWARGGGSAPSATLLFNRVGQRIREAGEQPLPDVVEVPRNSIDASLRWPARGDLQFRVDARNLADSPHLIMQGSVKRDTYRSGRSLQVGLTLQR